MARPPRRRSEPPRSAAVGPRCAERVRARFPGTAVSNLYGPCEATVYSNESIGCADYDAGGGGTAPVGPPLPNVKARRRRSNSRCGAHPPLSAPTTYSCCQQQRLLYTVHIYMHCIVPCVAY